MTLNLYALMGMEYDGNGDMTYDGNNNYFEYDDENQLTAVSDVHTTWRSEFIYDGRMRRRVRKEYRWTGSSWLLTNEVHYIYDRNLVIQERDALNAPVVTYTRGKDLSGSLEGAGGIGGLLARTDDRAGTTAFYHADRLGNVTMLINAQQIPVAKYLYDPFGNTLSASGPLADGNLYRFSSKETHANSGLSYYLYRFCSSALQRWLNRDPLGEPGFEILRRARGWVGNDGPNLYAFLGNNAVGRVDHNGLKLYLCTVPTQTAGPTLGIGRHAYLWDDRSGTPSSQRECGQESSSGKGGNTSGNTGPITGSSGGVRPGTRCEPVDGSDGKEDDVMKCCRENANKGFWFPGITDCHNKAKDCLASNGLTPPFNPRFPAPICLPGDDGLCTW